MPKPIFAPNSNSSPDPAPSPCYRLELASGLIDRTHWWKNNNGTEPANIWWLHGEGPLTGTLAGRIWHDRRPATDAEIEMWLEIQRLREQLAARDRAVMDNLCGASFEHVKNTCTLPAGHTGEHLVYADGTVMLRPNLERAPL